MFECKFCGRICKNLISQRQHEVRCPKNPERKAYSNLSTYVQNYRKGKTKENCEDIRKQSEVLKQLYTDGKLVSPQKGKPGTFRNKHHTDETKKKIGESVSKTRKKHYADGTITPAHGVGRGKYSYIIYKDKKYMCRSTYEFIYSLYLLKNHIEFDMEAIRVPAIRKNRFSNTFISDFSYGNTVVEVKGIKSGKDYYIKESFEAAGYKFIELYESDIIKCKDWLISNGLDIDNLIDKIVEGHNSRNYFTYKYAG